MLNAQEGQISWIVGIRLVLLSNNYCSQISEPSQITTPPPTEHTLRHIGF